MIASFWGDLHNRPAFKKHITDWTLIEHASLSAGYHYDFWQDGLTRIVYVVLYRNDGYEDGLYTVAGHSFIGTGDLPLCISTAREWVEAKIEELEEKNDRS